MLPPADDNPALSRHSCRIGGLGSSPTVSGTRSRPSQEIPRRFRRRTFLWSTCPSARFRGTEVRRRNIISKWLDLRDSNEQTLCRRSINQQANVVESRSQAANTSALITRWERPRITRGRYTCSPQGRHTQSIRRPTTVGLRPLSKTPCLVGTVGADGFERNSRGRSVLLLLV